ncbi:MAG: hypothetical protein ACYS9X_29300 [Planctomycetota bacterium]|jgi:hypothetical protein
MQKSRRLARVATAAVLAIAPIGCSYEAEQVVAAAPAVGWLGLWRMLAVGAGGGTDYVVSGGMEASAGTGIEYGRGPAFAVGLAPDMVEVTVSFIESDDEPGRKVTRYRATFEESTGRVSRLEGSPEQYAGWVDVVGPAWYVGSGEEWGIGWTWGRGWALVRERSRVMLMPTLDVWLGEDEDDDFAAGVEAAVRLVIGMRF